MFLFTAACVHTYTKGSRFAPGSHVRTRKNDDFPAQLACGHAKAVDGAPVVGSY
jgi:hypothetical protein